MTFTTSATNVSNDLHQSAIDSLDALSNVLCNSSYSFEIPWCLDNPEPDAITKSECANMNKETRSMIKTATGEEPEKCTVNITEKLEAKFAFMHTGLDIKRVIFSDPCTIILWKDGTKTIVRVREGEEFSPYHGFCAAIAKKMFGSNNKLSRFVYQWTEKNEKK